MSKCDLTNPWKTTVTAALLAFTVAGAACTTAVPVPPHDLMPGTLMSICGLLQAVKSPESLPQSVIIHGKVTRLVWCPPCPRGAGCAVCPREHIVMEDGRCSIIIPGNFRNRLTVQFSYCVSLDKGESPSDFPYHPYRLTGWQESVMGECTETKSFPNHFSGANPAGRFFITKYR